MRRLLLGGLVGAYLLYVVAWQVREAVRGWRNHAVAWVRIDTGVRHDG